MFQSTGPSLISVNMGKGDYGKIKDMLKDTITLLCKNGLSYSTEFSVEALIGITLDRDNVLLVSINEKVTNSAADSTSGAVGHGYAESHPQRKRVVPTQPPPPPPKPARPPAEPIDRKRKREPTTTTTTKNMPPAKVAYVQPAQPPQPSCNFDPEGYWDDEEEEGLLMPNMPHPGMRRVPPHFYPLDIKEEPSDEEDLYDPLDPDFPMDGVMVKEEPEDEWDPHMEEMYGAGEHGEMGYLMDNEFAMPPMPMSQPGGGNRQRLMPQHHFQSPQQQRSASVTAAAPRHTAPQVRICHTD